jgi:16S rRNA (guanine527-N7)-methyltransferase
LGATGPGVDEHIDALAERYELPAGAIKQLREFLRLLVDDTLAPTAIRDPVRAVEDHLADALVGLQLEPVRRASVIADLGSGAGLPGLPLAIALPQAQVDLVESAIRRCDFLRRAVAECDVPNARVVHTRAESWSEGLRRFDLVTARALAPLGAVIEYAAPVLRVGGMLVAWRGRRNADDEAVAARAAAKLGVEIAEVVPVSPYPHAKERHLHLMLKVTETPRGFPRRPGVALKRPLGRTKSPRPEGMPSELADRGPSERAERSPADNPERTASDRPRR